MRINTVILYLLVFLFFRGVLYGQERPKVGLVLSGGSAHGLAHIGVLKYLEEKKIPVDYITGTSMGSIIGGLYAMGVPADEIEKIANQQNWSELLSTDVPLEDIAPSEKLYHNRYMITVELSKNGIRLPQGFFNSQKLDLTLNRMFRAAYKTPHFDSLPYPFRCMSVNIENGEVVELEDGFLGHAIRASMAIPSVFTPVDINGELLVDGGLIRNFPVEEIRKMGADIVIGVYVGSKLEERDKLNTLVDILSQSAFMMGILDSKKQKENVDVLIEPDVKEMPSFGFDLSEDLIEKGYRSAVERSTQLDSLEEFFENYQFEKPEKLRQPSAVDLSDTRFPYVKDPFDDLAEFKYGPKRKGSVTFDYVDQGITRVFGTKHFKNINYTFHGDGRGGRIMDVLAEPREVNTFSVALNYMPTSGTSVIITNESRNLLSQPSVLYTTVRIAENFGAKLDYYNRLGKNRDFIFHVKAQGHRYDQDLLDRDVTKERLKETHVSGQVGVGYEPNNVVWANAYTGIENVFLNPIEEREEDFQGYDRINFVLGSALQLNTLDELQFPTTGVDFQADLIYRLSTKSELDNNNPGNIAIPEDKSYLQAGAKFDVFYPLSDRLTISGFMNFGTKTSTSLSNNFRIGGFEDRDIWSISQIGLRTHQFHMSSYVQSGAFLRFRVGGSVYLSARADYLNGDRTFVQQDFDPSQRELSSLSVGGIISIRTPLGPFHLGYGKNTSTDDWNTNVTFGYNFF